ncbi:substrate import-associated zinc metallohydrolase lipoprotein [Sphingobacterium sp. LRF_L2]|uniref:substrate import-associated zinc metallohydrolase lipoprotein n=1 Tax=Sphingobacterium sp. LRF_L2 TaxID=3369421 RepID=UPI003F62DEC1
MKISKIQFFSISLLILACFSCFSGCKGDESLPEEEIIGLGGDDWVWTDLDEYLYQNFTLPYNIDVKYKWDPYEVNYNKNLVPPDETKVIPVMETIKAIWVDPYEKVAGLNFLRTYQLLKYVLVGSAEYQSNGTIILGTAEGGNQITLFVINDFAKSDYEEVIRMMHTIHHEFAHILHQKIDYPQAWRGLSTQWYTATWFNTSNATANTQGMITAYAKAAEREDFVETIAFLLVEGQEAFDAIVAANPAVASTFRAKENLVVEYFAKLGVDFRALQTEVRAGIVKITQ